MVFLHNNRGYYYVSVKVKRDGCWRLKHIKSLGQITQKEAEKHLQGWKKRIPPNTKIKPIYRTIVIDPPWPMEKIPRKVRPNQIDMDYDTMSIEEIKGFPLKSFVSGDGCHLYLWTTHKHLPSAFEVLKAWGVNYQCLLTWVKNVGITPFSWMYSTELVLFGGIGNLSLIKKGVRLDFNDKVREHSRKPDKFYEIVKRVSPEPRIDIFSREKRQGFDQYGYGWEEFEG